MALTRYEPWSLLNQLSRELGRIYEPGKTSDEDNSVIASDWVPAVDIKEEENRFVIHADIPGVEPKDIHVNMENGILTISGERSSETKEEREGYRRVERTHGTFLRRFTLPDTTDAEKISAKSKNGVLEVIIPKHDRVQPRKITVNG